jgi:cysteinyl-tRNA synthetase
VRFFSYLGYKVRYASNFTDIDDKIIARANELGISETELTEKFINSIRTTYKRLNTLKHDYNPTVTENMNEIIDFISLLITKGGAYVSGGDVYFDVLKVDDYGLLSGQAVENLINGARVEENEKKNNPLDFTLWKETSVGLNWESPWSKGRPGWHTECVVMIDKIFKGKIDIHGGGLDLKFPHHDNEIAQSVCAHDHKIANYWMHNGRLDLAGEKMSKSLGNVIWANDLLDEVPIQVFRIMMHNVPYRQPLVYKDEVITQATTDYEKIKRAYNSLYRKVEALDKEELSIKDLEIEVIKTEFIDYLSDDFNTANALTAIFKMTKIANNLVRDKAAESGKLKYSLEVFSDMLWVLGIETNISPLTSDQKDLLERYDNARKEKNFELSDELRVQIINEGLEI